MPKTINLIGAGISGLCAGCYLQMNGYQTKIFEMHDQPGGLCTSWQRNGFTIDTCIHWLFGADPRDEFYALWNELIDMRKMDFNFYDIFYRIEDESGKYINFYTDLVKLKDELLTKAPEDKELIINFIDSIKTLTKFRLPLEKASENFNLFDKIKFITKLVPFFSQFKKWLTISAKDYAAQFKNPLLRFAMDSMFIPEMAEIFILLTLARFENRFSGYPIGGSLNFSKLIEKRYIDLGGKINYKSKVTGIITEENDINQSATGIILENGQKIVSDIVISAADGHNTIFDMLKGRFIDKEFENYYDNYPVFASYLLISLGVNRVFDNVSPSIIFKIPDGLVIDEETVVDSVTCRIYNFDKTLAPEGKTLLTIMLQTNNFEYWAKLRNSDLNKYSSEKKRIADEIINILDIRLGNIKDNVEMIDVSTPATVVRYTNNWKGSFEGWIVTPKVGFKHLKKQLPGLNNFYMIGQWVEPGGGLPSAILSGRSVAQIICKGDKVKFKTEHF